MHMTVAWVGKTYEGVRDHVFVTFLERIADKTVPKMMRGAGVDCGIRCGADCHRCKSCRGVAGETFGNAVGRGFGSGGPRGKMGADAAEPKQP